MNNKLRGIDRVRVLDNTNNVASTFVEENYDRLVADAVKMKVDPNFTSDLVNDVYVSLKRSESNGEGYNANKGNRDTLITVTEFVYGRMKGYSYRYLKGRVSAEESASSSGEVSELSATQMAYENASSYDDIEVIEDTLSLREEINYILTFQSSFKLDLKFFLKNIQEIASIDIDVSIMDELREAFKNKEEMAEFIEALTSVVKFSGRQKEEYASIVGAMC